MFKRIVRRDGSVIILAPKAGTNSATLEVLYKVGSRQENSQNNGVSHFVEHLMFKGTKKRPNTVDIAKELDGVGAEYNAFTGKEYTGYYITADSSHLSLATDMLSDMLYNSKFDPKEMERERGVIVEEINMYEDNPLMYIEDVFEDLLFKNTALGKQIAGPRKNIKNISRQALYNYYKKYYYNGNAVIGLAGNFKEAAALKLVNKFFPISTRKSRTKVVPVPKLKQTSPQITIVDRNLEQVQLMLGFKSVAAIDPKFMVSQVLANILGGTMSSRLFLSIRERKGLCYSIHAGINAYEDISSFVVQAGLNTDKIYEALSAIKEELNMIRDKGVSQTELIKAKDNMRGRMILKLENSSSYLNFLIAQEVMGERLKDLPAKIKDLDSVTLEQVNNMVKQIIDWRGSSLAVIGPFKKTNNFLNILKK